MCSKVGVSSTLNVRLCLVSVALSLAGCAASEEEDSALSESAFHGASETPYEHPEIGQTDIGCTATLIAKDVAISSAHCGDPTTLRFDLAEHSSYTADIRRIWKHPRYTGRELNLDVALYFLENDVPSALAPFRLAADKPRPLGEVEAFGYGPTDCSVVATFGPWRVGTNGTTGLRKRKRTFRWGVPQRPCGGDSGGPTLHKGTREIIGTTTGAIGAYLTVSQWAPIRAELRAQMTESQWAQAAPAK